MNDQNSTTSKKKRPMGLLYLLLIFLPPVGIILLWIWKPWATRSLWIVTAVSTFWFFYMLNSYEENVKNQSPAAVSKRVSGKTSNAPKQIRPPNMQGKSQTKDKASEKKPPSEYDVFWQQKELKIFDCKEDWWALFNIPVPGEDEFEKKRNKEAKKSIAQKLRRGLYYVVDNGVDYGEYDFKRKRFPLLIGGLYNCKVAALSLSRAKVVDKIGGDPRLGLYEWEGNSLKYYVNVPESAAENFKKNHRSGLFGSGLNAKVAFKIRNTRVHKKMVPDPDFGGKVECGAGPLIEAKIMAVRIADKEMVLVDKVFK